MVSQYYLPAPDGAGLEVRDPEPLSPAGRGKMVLGQVLSSPPLLTKPDNYDIVSIIKF